MPHSDRNNTKHDTSNTHRKAVRSTLFVDDAAIAETAGTYVSAVSFNATDAGILALCRDIDDMMGTPRGSYNNMSDIANNDDPRCSERSWYVTLVAYFTVLSRLSGDIVSYLQAKAELACGHYPQVYGKRASKARIQPRAYSMSTLLPRLITGIDAIGFEPEWLMRWRGAAKRLPNDYPYNIWGYIHAMLVDYEKSVDVMPPYVVKQLDKIPGLRRLVDRAIAEGHTEMRNVYGDDVDLIPRADNKIPEKYVPMFSNPEKMREIKKGINNPEAARVRHRKSKQRN